MFLVLSLVLVFPSFSLHLLSYSWDVERSSSKDEKGKREPVRTAPIKSQRLAQLDFYSL
jgi:hypothetical protein